VKTLGDGRAEKRVPFLDFPNRGAYTVSGSLFDQITGGVNLDNYPLRNEWPTMIAASFGRALVEISGVHAANRALGFGFYI